MNVEQQMVIMAAAIRQGDRVYTGRRHCEIICDIARLTGMLPGAVDLGFVTSDGDFVDRERAAEIALRAGQIKELKYNKTKLYSEELW
jgi:copper homeostasis protein CutC